MRRPIILSIYISLAALCAVIFAACGSTGSDEPAAPGAIGLDIYQAINSAWDVPDDIAGFSIRAGSRAEGDDALAAEAAALNMSVDVLKRCKRGVKPQTIGVYGYSRPKGTDESIVDDVEPVFSNQKIYRRNGTDILSCGFDYSTWPADNNWPYDPPKSWDYSRKYRFYVYGPYLGEETPVPYDPDYLRFSKLSITHIPPIDDESFMVAHRVHSDVAGVQPKFEMLNLSSRLCFLFKVGEEYSKMRQIKLKSVEINKSGDYYYYYYYYYCDITNIIDGEDVEVNLDYHLDPFPTTTFDLRKEYLDYDEIEDRDDEPFTNDEGMLLTKDYQLFTSLYAIPGSFTSATITVVYDVYDMEGQLLRPNQRTRNTLHFGKLSAMKHGHFYPVRIVVSPKYLYVLSDNDVMPDGLVEVAL